jgi:type IV secretion system protein VirD4
MVSRQETARLLLTPGEIMQLPASDELVLICGTPPIRAKKTRYFGDIRLLSRVLPPPVPTQRKAANSGGRSCQHKDDWTGLAAPSVVAVEDRSVAGSFSDDPENGGIRREPTLPLHEAIVPEARERSKEFAFDEPAAQSPREKLLRRRFQNVARQAALDPDDGLDL